MRASAAAVAAALALLACQQIPRYSPDEPEEVKRPWKEIAVDAYPAYPRSEALVQFNVGDASPHRFYIDPPSLAIGADGVVRYTLVTRTAGGATNVTYEGIRCEDRRHKVYALGRDGGTWTPARNAEWRRIERQNVDRQRVALIEDFLCVGAAPRKTEKDMLNRLRWGPVERQFN